MGINKCSAKIHTLSGIYSEGRFYSCGSLVRSKEHHTFSHKTVHRFIASRFIPGWVIENTTMLWDGQIGPSNNSNLKGGGLLCMYRALSGKNLSTLHTKMPTCLLAHFKKALVELRREHLKQVCERFRSRTGAVIELKNRCIK